MPSKHPPSRVFVYPEVAALAAVFAKREDTDVSTIIRSAIIWAALNPEEMECDMPGKRATVLTYRVPGNMRHNLKMTALYGRRSVSEYVALATTLYVTALADEVKNGKPDDTLIKARTAMRKVVSDLRERGELPEID
jgi:hypothetical protein